MSVRVGLVPAQAGFQGIAGSLASEQVSNSSDEQSAVDSYRLIGAQQHRVDPRHPRLPRDVNVLTVPDALAA